MAQDPTTPARPDPNKVDDAVQKGFAGTIWILSAAIVVVLLLAAFMFMSRSQQASGPSTETARPERTVPPQGQTGDVPQSRSPVQR